MTETPIRTDWLARWALYAPDRVAIDDLDAGRSVTYAEAARIVHRTARWLRDEHGIAAGDRVAVLAPNALEYVLLFFAVQRLGAILVPVNWRLAPREVAHVVTDAEPALVVVDASFADKLDGADVRTLDFAELQARMHDESLPADLDAPEPDFDAACMILYTSGTTGAPKGAVLTNRGIFWNSVNTGLRLNLTEADRTAIFAPLFHTGGWHVLTTPILHHGGTILLTGFDPDRVLRLCDERGLTILFGVPTMLAMMHEHARLRRGLARLGPLRDRRRRADADPADPRVAREGRPDPAGLRADRVRPERVLAPRARRRAEGRLHRLPQLLHRRPRRGRRRRRTPRRRDRRARAARPGRDAGLLAQPRGHGRDAHATAGSTPATSSAATPRATSTSSGGRRRCSSAGPRTSTPPRSRASSRRIRP